MSSKRVDSALWPLVHEFQLNGKRCVLKSALLERPAVDKLLREILMYEFVRGTAAESVFPKVEFAGIDHEV